MGINFSKTTSQLLIGVLNKITLQYAYKPDIYDERFGFYLYYHDNKVVISVIYEKMPAMETGLQLGDEVLNIDNLNFENVTREQFCNDITDIIKYSKKTKSL